MGQSYQILCLGDSYTIGEGVPIHESFPYQTVQRLRNLGLPAHAPEIVARTGWTTGELIVHLNHYKLSDAYHAVTLLIGVNNQYRGLSLHQFEIEMNELINRAISFAGNKPEHVIVISIPDWGATPFAEGRDSSKISHEIDTFNLICSEKASLYKVHFIEITKSTRRAKDDLTLIANDRLHYSGIEMAVWAEKVTSVISQILL